MLVTFVETGIMCVILMGINRFCLRFNFHSNHESNECVHQNATFAQRFKVRSHELRSVEKAALQLLQNYSIQLVVAFDSL